VHLQALHCDYYCLHLRVPHRLDALCQAAQLSAPLSVQVHSSTVCQKACCRLNFFLSALYNQFQDHSLWCGSLVAVGHVICVALLFDVFALFWTLLQRTVSLSRSLAHGHVAMTSCESISGQNSSILQLGELIVVEAFCRPSMGGLLQVCTCVCSLAHEDVLILCHSKLRF
jgi:hypothetical protein